MSKIKGVVFTETHKQRIGIALRKAFAEGRKSNKGENNPRYGQHCTEETKKKISAIHKGKRGMVGPNNPMYGKRQSKESIKKSADAQRGKPKHSEEHKQRLREKCLRFNPMDTPEARKKRSESLMGKLVGDKNPNWRGGSSFEPYCPKFNREFKNRVRAFFDNKCIECGTPQNGTVLSVHHVNYLKDACCDPNAIPLFVALCSSCHSKTNGDRKRWDMYFTELITTYYEGKCYLSKEEMVALTIP